MGEREYPHAYLEYLVEYHAKRDYFECHEILEDYWKDHPESEFRETWVMLIQLAVSLYHQRRGNFKGAIKLMSGALRRFEVDHMYALGVDGGKMRNMMRTRLEKLEANPTLDYQDLDIPIIDQSLLTSCKELATRIGEVWGQPSNMEDEYLLNRHKLRDRTEVNKEREAAHIRKQASREGKG